MNGSGAYPGLSERTPRAGHNRGGGGFQAAGAGL